MDRKQSRGQVRKKEDSFLNSELVPAASDQHALLSVLGSMVATMAASGFTFAGIGYNIGNLSQQAMLQRWFGGEDCPGLQSLAQEISPDTASDVYSQCINAWQYNHMLVPVAVGAVSGIVSGSYAKSCGKGALSREALTGPIMTAVVYGGAAAYNSTAVTATGVAIAGASAGLFVLGGAALGLAVVYSPDIIGAVKGFFKRSKQDLVSTLKSEMKSKCNWAGLNPNYIIGQEGISRVKKYLKKRNHDCSLLVALIKANKLFYRGNPGVLREPRKSFAYLDEDGDLKKSTVMRDGRRQPTEFNLAVRSDDLQQRQS